MWVVRWSRDNYPLFRKWARIPSPSWRRVKEEKRESLLPMTLVLRIRQLWLNLPSAARYRLRNEGKLTVGLCQLQWCVTRIHLRIERIHTVTINLISPHNLYKIPGKQAVRTGSENSRTYQPELLHWYNTKFSWLTLWPQLDWQASNFSLQYHSWVQHQGRENIGNDH